MNAASQVGDPIRRQCLSCLTKLPLPTREASTPPKLSKLQREQRVNFGLAILGAGSQFWAPEANFELGGQILGFGGQFWAEANVGLWSQFWALFGQPWALGAKKAAFGASFGLCLGANFRLWEANFGLWEANFGLWKPTLGFGSHIWALGGDLGFGLPGPGKAPEV